MRRWLFRMFPGRGLSTCLLALTFLGTSCQTVYLGQAAVPNTKQRLVVGHDGGPFARIWVIEGGKAHDVKIVRGAAR